jgi:hypothetical protein
LTPIQRWFFEQGFARPHHWNQAFLLQGPADLAVPRLEQALQWVLGQHDVFRLRFVQSGADPVEDWQASYLPQYEPIPFQVVDLRQLPEEQQASSMQKCCNQEQASLHLGDGPLARAVLFRLAGAQPWRLLLLSHHLVIDTVSWRILLEELSLTYERLRQGQPLEPLVASNSFQEWAQRLQDYAQSEALQQEAASWLQHPLPPLPWPLDEPAGDNREACVQSIEQHLGREDTHALLREVAQRTRASVEEVLLTALALACADCFGSTSLAIDLEDMAGRTSSPKLISRVPLAGLPLCIRSCCRWGRGPSQSLLYARSRADCGVFPSAASVMGCCAICMRTLNCEPTCGSSHSRRSASTTWDSLTRCSALRPSSPWLLKAVAGSWHRRTSGCINLMLWP